MGNDIIQEFGSTLYVNNDKNVNKAFKVIINYNGYICCQYTCSRYKSLNICSYCVALASKVNVLASFIKLTKSKKPNVERLINFDKKSYVEKKNKIHTNKKKVC